jgi:hypothetical protein
VVSDLLCAFRLFLTTAIPFRSKNRNKPSPVLYLINLSASNVDEPNEEADQQIKTNFVPRKRRHAVSSSESAYDAGKVTVI